MIGYSPWGHKELDTTEQLRFPELQAESLLSEAPRKFI